MAGAAMNVFLLGGAGIVGLFLYARFAAAKTAQSQPIVPQLTQGQINVGTGIDKVCSISSMASQVASAASGVPSSGGQCGGGILGSLLGAFMAGHIKRAKEAINENAAVTNFIPAYDQAISQAVAAYNSGQLSAIDLNNFLDQVWASYWAEVGGMIQPGRNGCQSGALPQTTAGKCSGDWGAACCVGYSDLAKGFVNVKRAVASTESSGQPATANIPQIFPSKYGLGSRAGYTVTLQKPNLILGAAGSFDSFLSTLGKSVGLVH